MGCRLIARGSFGRSVARTSVCNVVAAGAAGLAGVLIARSLGPEGRGEYAAVLAWFGVVLVLGQLGQTAATTYFVARHRAHGPDYLATSRNLMVASGLLTLAGGLLAAPLLSAGSGAATAGYRLMFATCLVSFVGASYVFSLQAVNLARWNVARVCQPVAYLLVVVILALAGRLDLMAALVALSVTLWAQTGFAYWLCRREGLTRGRASRVLARPLTRYGLGQLASAAPGLVTTRLGMLVLSMTVPAASLGQYAVAASVTAMAQPVVSAVGNVAFPRIASGKLSAARQERLQRVALLSSALIAVVLLLPVVVTAPWLLPLVFGAGFQDAALLLWLLAPGGVLLATGRVSADLLKGQGRPYAVAGAQTVAAVATVGMLAVLVPLLGAAGAAISASVAAAVALAFMLWSLRRPPARAGGDSAATAVAGAHT